jgi:hypothetical protein
VVLPPLRATVSPVSGGQTEGGLTCTMPGSTYHCHLQESSEEKYTYKVHEDTFINKFEILVAGESNKEGHNSFHIRNIYTHVHLCLYSVEVEVLTAVVMKSSVFWDVTPCSPFIVIRRFRETVFLLAYSSSLKMEATCSSETSVDYQRTIQSYIPEDRTLFFLYYAPCISHISLADYSRSNVPIHSDFFV